MAKRTTYCNFCGVSGGKEVIFTEGDKVDGVTAYVCGECIKKALPLVEAEELRRSPRDQKLRNIPHPRNVYDHLGDYVIGQDRAKRVLSVNIVNHYKRLLDMHDPKQDASDLQDVKIEKSNVLLIGPSGSGKTLLAKSLADKLGVPFAIGDATTITEAGYVGEDVENLLLKLLVAADYDVEAAQRGIIYIDEIDKIHKTGGNVSVTRDVSGEGVQQSLLKILEGTMASIPPQGGRKHPEQQYIQMDTTNILFICGGAFNGIETIIAQRLGKRQIGFGNVEGGVSDAKQERNALLQKIEPHDLEQFGMIPEFVGRLPVVTALSELSLEELERILTEPKNALCKQYRKIFSYDNAELEFTPEAISEIALIAKEKGTGARALRNVIENMMTDLMFDLPSEACRKQKHFVIDAEVVRGTKSPMHLTEAA